MKERTDGYCDFFEEELYNGEPEREFGILECYGENQRCNVTKIIGKCMNTICEGHAKKCSKCIRMVCSACITKCDKCEEVFCLECAQLLQCSSCKKSFCIKCGEIAGRKEYCNECNPYKTHDSTAERDMKLFRKAVKEHIADPKTFVEFPDGSITDAFIAEDFIAADEGLDEVDELLDEILDRSS